MYLSQTAKYICPKLQNVFVSNYKMYLSQSGVYEREILRQVSSQSMSMQSIQVSAIDPF